MFGRYFSTWRFIITNGECGASLYGDNLTINERFLWVMDFQIVCWRMCGRQWMYVNVCVRDGHYYIRMRNAGDTALTWKDVC